jgi:hypothetical protein
MPELVFEIHWPCCEQAILYPVLFTKYHIRQYPKSDYMDLAETGYLLSPLLYIPFIMGSNS